MWRFKAKSSIKIEQEWLARTEQLQNPTEQPINTTGSNYPSIIYLARLIYARYVSCTDMSLEVFNQFVLYRLCISWVE
jgi:hypothetical protein